MKKLFLTVTLSLAIRACLSPLEARAEGLLEDMGNFELSPTQRNTCWGGEDNYDYNEYEIAITSLPCVAKIVWDGEQIGATPIVYKYTGTLYADDNIVVKAIPIDRSFPQKIKRFSGFRPLPRKIHFDFGEE